jgi:26S proteasome regulatory subunit N2
VRVLCIPFLAVYMRVQEVDYVSVCHCLQFLDEASSVSEVLVQLCKAAGDSTTAAQQSSVLLAYQIAFDLVESENQVRTVG